MRASPLPFLIFVGVAVASSTLAFVASAGPASGTEPTTPDASSPSSTTEATADAASAQAATTEVDGGAPADAAPATTQPEPPPTETAPLVAVVDAGAPKGEGPTGLGFTVGLRAGFSVPFGTAKDATLGDVVTHSIPLGIDVGYFINKRLYVGAYVMYGFATNGNASSTCSDPNITCSANQWRFGVTGRYHWDLGDSFSPWAGAALGYDIVNLTATDDTGADTPAGSLHGLELGLLGGIDYKPLRYLGIGPYAELAMGHYAIGDSSTASSTALHAWLTFGLRFRTGL